MSAAAKAFPIFPRELPAPKREIIGANQGLRDVCNAIRMVARTDSSVLIQGETGTGKEVIATQIHEESLRSRGPFVKLNCAAMPAGLLESELFGHERGAFTGAYTQTIGRFERADQGTLFLDEIGELPIELQPKLLRVLQQQEFERLGGTRTIRVNVRIIAATNQNLEQMLEERRFREDLYYRINVFPISLPPLRERPEDIALLVRHFVDVFTRRLNRQCNHIPGEVMAALKRHRWPGNIRELQNVIERSVILSGGLELRVPDGEFKNAQSKTATIPANRTLAELERSYILQVLEESHWKLGGREGAAAHLGIARTTLIHRMRRLGIERETAMALENCDQVSRVEEDHPPSGCDSERAAWAATVGV